MDQSFTKHYTSKASGAYPRRRYVAGKDAAAARPREGMDKVITGQKCHVMRPVDRSNRWPNRRMSARVVGACVMALVALASHAPDRARAADDAYPKFFSLKSNPVNLRKGPGTKYPKAWVFRREGLPVEVLRAHGRWRHVRDSDGATGWILRTLISSRRTALVSPWKLKEKTAPETPQLTLMHDRATRRSRAVAQLEAGTLVSLKSCNGQWCHVSIDRFRGYIEQKLLWGIYPAEILR